jgi:hypothetical protein
MQAAKILKHSAYEYVERAREMGISVVSATPHRKQDGPPLPQREEREIAPLLLFE